MTTLAVPATVGVLDGKVRLPLRGFCSDDLIAFFADRVGFTAAQITSLTHGSPIDSCWTDPAERALLTLVDALHDTADVDDAGWEAATAHLDDAQLLDACLLTGWYHAISFAANAARVPLEAGAPRFADVV